MLVQHLKTGNSLEPFVYIDPDVSPLCTPGEDLRLVLEHDERCPCDNNRPLSYLACDATLLARQNKDSAPSGYRYPAALIEALEYRIHMSCSRC